MIGKCHTQDSVLVRCLKHKDEMQRHTIIHAIEKYCYIVYMKTTGNGYILIYHTKLRHSANVLNVEFFNAGGKPQRTWGI